MGIGWTLRDNDWNKLRQIIQKIASLQFGYDAVPTFGGLNINGNLSVSGSLTLSSLTPSRLVQSDSSSSLASADLSSFIAGTANRITVTSDGVGGVVLSAPQDLHNSAIPTFNSLTLNSGSDSCVLYLNSSKTISFSTDFTYVYPALNVMNLNIPNTTVGGLKGKIMQNNVPILHSIGGYINLFLGAYSGNFLHGGEYNTGIGYYALSSIDTPYAMNNVAIGSYAGKSITLGFENVFIGYAAGQNITTASNVMLLGTYTGMNLTLGDFTTAIGAGALMFATTGGDNVAIGTSCCLNITTGSRNVSIGNYNEVGGSGSSDNISIGHSAGSKAFTNCTRTLAIGVYAGSKNTASNVMIIDMYPRITESEMISNALFYGSFDPYAQNQTLRVNAGTLIFNAGASTNLAVNFYGTSNNGLFYWMHSDDRFRFDDDILLNSTERLYLNSANHSIHSDGTNLILTTSGNVSSSSAFKGPHKSSDGTSGVTGVINLTTATSITVKDGLITAWS